MPEAISGIKISLLACAAVGAFAHWLAIRYGSVDRGLDLLVEDYSSGEIGKLTLKVAIFVSLGAILAVIMVSPTTARQAVAAGMAWTTLLNQAVPGRKRKAERRAPLATE